MQPFTDPRTPAAEELISAAQVMRSGMCIGCGSCVSAEASARMQWDKDGFLQPAADSAWLEAGSEYVTSNCPFSPAAASEDTIALERLPSATVVDARLGRFEAAYVGHVAEDPFRMQGSSGGLTTWVAAELLRTGKVDAVAHVCPADSRPDGRFFEHRLSRTLEDLNRGAKSRYYPIELSSVLRTIRATPGRYAIIGIPCFIKAVQLLRRSEPLLRERITHTLGLFCGHMKSAALVESFAWQLGAEIGRVRAVDYRFKDPGRPANWYRAQLRLEDGSESEQDWWHLADGDWGAGYFQNPACNWCDDVTAETADIAFGDAWVEPYTSDGRGTNVVIARTKQMKAMLNSAGADGRLQLEPVSADFVAQTQAAGLRHRREGLAYRLTWARDGIRPRKRVSPSAQLPLRRKLIYRLRYLIAAWSNRIFRLARALGWPRLYLVWARSTLRFYQALAWSRGSLGRLFDVMLPNRGV